MRLTLIAVVITALTEAAYGQLFERTDFNGPSVTEPSSPWYWVDLNGDGKMDILEISGYNSPILHKADGDAFTSNSLDVGNAYLSEGYYVFNDHNGDGDIDILTIKDNAVVVLDYDAVDGVTTIATGITFPSSYYGKIYWADLNGDLTLDFILGRKIYLKVNGSYKESTFQLPELLSNLILDDLNGDGLTDIVSGEYESYDGTTVSILVNLGDGHFDTNLVTLPATNLRSATILLLDAEGDSDIDIFATDYYNRSWIFRNTLAQNGSLQFSRTQISTEYVGRALVGDLNSDGLQDIGIIGGQKLIILKNASTPSVITFTAESYDEAIDPLLSFALVDIDLDNDLDIHCKMFSYESGLRNLIFQNNSVSPGPIPGVAGNLSSIAADNISLSWTSVPGTLYNVKVKKNGAIYKPSSTSPSGKLLLSSGNFLRRNGTLILRELPAGTYQWSVQSISPSGRSSTFSAESTFTVGEGPSNLTVQASELRKVRLCWTYAGAGTPSFVVFRKASSGTAAEIGRTNAGVFCFDDNDIPANETVEYYVTALSGESQSAASNTVKHHSRAFVETSFGMEDPNIISALCFPADYDMDGDYDLHFIGRIGFHDNNYLLKNNGSGAFVAAGPMLTSESFRIPYINMAGPRDIDNDGDPDLVVITGSEYSWQKVTVFKNNNGTFTTGFETPAYLDIVQLEVEDMNSDGRLDLLFTHRVGNSSGNPPRFQMLYQKVDGSFEDSHIQLSNTESTAVAFFRCVDMNSDGHLDILWTPSDGNTTEILVNVGGMAFRRVPTILPANYYVGVEDYTGDGYMDVAMPGNDGLNVYFGSADLSFHEPKVVPLNTSSIGGKYVNADIDLNGWPDILIVGESNSIGILNNGNGTFKQSDILLQHNWGSSVTIADFENDGDIDLVKLGNDDAHQGFNYLYRNQLADINVVNAPPTAPGNFSVAYRSGKVVLQWSAATDDRTPSPLLTYNLHVVDGNGKVWLSSETNGTGGFRRRFGAGNAGHAISKTLNDLPSGTYTARVQSLDASFKLSGWSNDIQFTILAGPTNLAIERILLHKVSLAWTSSPGVETGSVIERRAIGSDWSTIATLTAGTTSYVDDALEYNKLYQYRVFEIVGAASTAISNIGEWNTAMWVMRDTEMPNISGYFDVADFTADGRMDMLINGGMIYNGNTEDITKATFENTEGGWVKRDITPSVLTASAVMYFSDLNGDFRPDIYQNGWVWDTGYHSEVFLNNGDKTFSPAANEFSDGTNSIQSFYDFDMDNDLDIVTTQPQSYPTAYNIYRNDGAGNYVNTGINACHLCGEIVAIADFDRDGDQDLIRYMNYNQQYQLFLYTPTGLTATETVFSAYENGIEIVDYNSDGFPDIVLKTTSAYHGGVVFKNLALQNGAEPKFAALNVNLSTGEQKVLSADFDHDGLADLAALSPYINILHNKGSDNFESYVVPDLRVGSPTTRIIDVDNDGDLDILLGGYLLKNYSEYLRKTQILENQTIVADKGIANLPPAIPDKLSSIQDEFGLHLTWSPPVDDHTPADGLGYDVVLYRDGKVITKGNVNPGTGQRIRLASGTFAGVATFHNLDYGTYSWRVQAIDASFAASALSEIATFTYVPAPPPIGDTLVYRCGRTVTIGGHFNNLKWYRDKEMKQFIKSGPLNPEDTQTVYVTQTLNGYEGVPRKVTISIVDKPGMPTSNPSPIILCETPGIPTLWATGTNIKWYSDQALNNRISSENLLQIPVADGTYYVTQTISGCESDALILQVKLKAINSSIYSDGAHIITHEDEADYYAWYRNSVYIGSTTEPKIPFDGEVATYEVFITKGQCYERSAPFVSTPGNITSVEEAPESVLTIYPNPTSATVVLKTNKNVTSMTIVDAIGKRVYSAPPNKAKVETLDVSQWSKGVYTIIISDGKDVYTKRLVVY